MCPLSLDFFTNPRIFLFERFAALPALIFGFQFH
jgi:hypothetical protein